MRIVLAILLASALLSGCSDPAPSEPSSSASPSASTATAPQSSSASMTAAGSPQASPVPPALTLDDCTNFGGVFPVPLDAARGALPAGFEPVASPSDPAGGATLYVLALRCTGSTVDGASAGPVDVAYAELAVVPPAEAALDGITDCTVPLFFTASTPAVGAVAAAYKLGVAGAGEVAWAEHTGAGDLVVSASLGDVAITLRGAYAPGPPGSLGSGGFALYGVQDGLLVSTIRASAAGGAAVDAVAALESTGLPLLTEARPVVRGFSVAGFSLAFAPA